MQRIFLAMGLVAAWAAPVDASATLTLEECDELVASGRRGECLEHTAELLGHIVREYDGSERISHSSTLLTLYLNWVGPEAYLVREGDLAELVPSEIRGLVTLEAGLRSRLWVGRRQEAVDLFEARRDLCSAGWCRKWIRSWERELGLWDDDPRHTWASARFEDLSVRAGDPNVCGDGGLKLKVAWGHLSLYTLPQTDDVALVDAAREMWTAARSELRRIGVEASSPLEVFLYEDSWKLCRWTSYACAPEQQHGMAFARPWVSRAHVPCSHLNAGTTHEVIHLVVSQHERGAIDRFLDEGLAVALGGGEHFRQRYRCPGLAGYAENLSTLDELWLLFGRHADTLERLGEPPCEPYGLAGVFAAFLVDRAGTALGPALREHPDRAPLLQAALGLTEDETLEAWKGWLADQPAYRSE